MEKYAGNVFLSYNAAEKIRFTLTTGIQHSLAQKVSNENGFTPLSTAVSDSRYADLRANLKNISAQASFIKGTQNPNYLGSKYDFNTIDASIEYNDLRGDLSLKPRLSYSIAV